MHSHILGIGTATPRIRLTQAQSFDATGYQSERVRQIFVNSDIDYGHFYFGGTPLTSTRLPINRMSVIFPAP